MLFFVLVCRKHDDKLDLESDPDDDGRPINRKYVFKQTGNLQDPNVKVNGYEKMDEDELNEARERRMKQVKIWQLLREIASYAIFIWILFIVSYANKDINSYQYQLAIKSSLTAGLKQVFDDCLGAKLRFSIVISLASRFKKCRMFGNGPGKC